MRKKRKRAELDLGETEQGDILCLESERRYQNLHVIGMPKSGKSSFLFNLITQDIRRGQGVMVIDPHGTLFAKTLAWCAKHRVGETRPLVVIDPSDPIWSVGLNVLDWRSRGQTRDNTAEDVLDTFREVWGAAGFDQTPRLARGLRALMTLLAANDLTLAEGYLLLKSTTEKRRGADPSEGDLLRAILLAKLTNPVIRENWEKFTERPPREFGDFFESTLNRLEQFIARPSVRTILGAVEGSIDFRRLMDEQAIVLVNLNDGPDFNKDTDGKLLGRLLLNQLIRQTATRPEELGEEKPFFVYVDECHRYVSSAVSTILDELRKRGVVLNLAHQYMSQLEQETTTRVRDAIMGIAQVKVIFQVSGVDADVFAKEVFRTELSVGDPDPRYDKPVVTGQVPVWLFSESHTTGMSVSHGTSEGTSTARGTSSGTSQAESWDADGNPRGESAGVSGGVSESTGRSTGSFESVSYSEAHTSGKHQTFANVYEVMPTRAIGLDEAVHLAGNRLVELRKREAIVRIPGKPSMKIRTLDEERVRADPQQVTALRAAAAKRSSCMRPRQTINLEIDHRQEILLRAARDKGRGPVHARPPSESEDWYE